MTCHRLRFNLFFLALPMTALAQWTNDMGQRGFTPGAPFDIKGLDSVNMVNGNLVVNIPLTSMAPGKGGFSFDLNLTYNSAAWNRIQEYLQYWQYNEFTSGYDEAYETSHRIQPAGTWSLRVGYTLEVEWRNYPGLCMNTYQWGPATQLFYLKPHEGVHSFRPRIIGPDGSPHVLYPVATYAGEWHSMDPDGWQTYNITGQPAPCIASFGASQAPQWLVGPEDHEGELTYATRDGTYLRLVTQNVAPGVSEGNLAWKLYFPDGSRQEGTGYFATALIDKNENKIVQDKTNWCFDPNGAPFETWKDQSPGAGDRCIQIDRPGGHTIVRQKGADGNDLTWDMTLGFTPYSFKYPCQALYDIYTPGLKECRGAWLEEEVLLWPHPELYLPVVTNLEISGFTCGGSPCSRNYQFLYNGTVSYMGQSGPYERNTGNLSSIVLPTGATIRYEYVQNFEPLTTPFVVTERKLEYNDPATGPETEISSYTIYPVYAYCNTVTTTGQGTTEHCFHPAASWGQIGGRVYRVTQPDGSSTESFWVYNPPPDFGGLQDANPVVKREVRNQAGAVQVSAITDYRTDVNGNIRQVDEYDWNSNWSEHPQAPYPFAATFPTPANFRRSTVTTYTASVPFTGQGGPAPNGYWQTNAARYLNSPASIEVSGAGAGSLTGFVYDGNANVIEEWRHNNEPNAPEWIVTYRTYWGGLPVTETDGNGAVTRYEYNNWGNVPYPTDLYKADGTGDVRHWSYNWNGYTGQVWAETDVDNSLTTWAQYDRRGRPTMVSEGNGARITYTYYDDAARKVTVKAPLHTAADQALVTETSFDQLGRKWKTRNVTLNTEVQELTRKTGNITYQVVSNPYTGTSPSGEATMGWTRTTIDGNGRVTEVASFWGAGKPWPWPESSGNSTGATTTGYGTEWDLATQLVTDAAGKKRLLKYDGLGRLTQVVEDPGGLNYATYYAYDALNNLIAVNQSGQGRNFTYSKLGRLLEAANPESGTTLYRYDNNGNLRYRVDARGILTTTGYDWLNRPIWRTYGDGTPTVQWGYYSGCGRRLCAVLSGGAERWYNYDALGRVNVNFQIVDGVQYEFYYEYKLNDALAKTTYPSGRVVENGFNAGGQVERVAKGLLSGPDSYVYAISYAAQGAPWWKLLGNNLVEYSYFDSRLRVAEVGVGPYTQETARMRLTNYWGASSNLDWQAINRPAFNASQNYEYDGVNRLIRATQYGADWEQTYGYDAWGNRWLASYTGLPAPTGEVPRGQGHYYAAANRISEIVPGQPWGYDAAGNVDHIPYIRVSTYDGENRQVSALNPNGETATYVYDGEGNRVKRTFQGVTTRFVYDAFGHLAAEYNSSTGLTEHIYGLGRHVATESSAGTRYYTQDHLGSTRLITKPDGTIDKDLDYLPFGEELGGFYPAVPGGPTVKFTGKERDAETGLDYFGARYMSAAQGRFTSPDAPFADQHPADPQSWNLYTYGRNNPLRFIDPSGMEAVSAEDCQNDSSCVSVKLNVILDKNANLYDRKGNLLPAYQTKLDQQIADTQSEYGDYNVHFEVSVVMGEFKNEKNVLTPVTGLDKAAINVGVTDSNQLGNVNATGKSGCVGGFCLSLVNLPQANRDTLPHEVAHHLAGDTARQLSGITGMVFNTGADLRTDFIRKTQFGPRPTPTPGFGTNFGMFNRGARRFGTR